MTRPVLKSQHRAQRDRRKKSLHRFADRGMRMFDEFLGDFDTEITVHESPCTQRAYVRIWSNQRGNRNKYVPLKINVPQAKRCIAALQQFVALAEAGALHAPAGAMS
jgi:hypothetical protein